MTVPFPVNEKPGVSHTSGFSLEDPSGLSAPFDDAENPNQGGQNPQEGHYGCSGFAEIRIPNALGLMVCVVIVCHFFRI